METDDEQFQSFSSDTSIHVSAESDRDETDEEELESPVEFIEEDSEVEVDLGEIAEYVDNEEIHLHCSGGGDESVGKQTLIHSLTTRG